MTAQGNRVVELNGARGQSTLEYLLVIAAVLAAVIVAASQFMKPAVNKMLEDSKTTIESASGKLRSGLGLQ